MASLLERLRKRAEAGEAVDLNALTPEERVQLRQEAAAASPVSGRRTARQAQTAAGLARPVPSITSETVADVGRTGRDVAVSAGLAQPSTTSPVVADIGRTGRRVAGTETQPVTDLRGSVGAAPEETARPEEIGLGLPPERITQEPFLFEREGQPGTFDVRGLRGGGTGVIEASGATGGPEAFAQRVEASRRAGAFEPVSAERRAQGQQDFENVKRGLSAMRELSATRLGVPVQYLDAVRSGSLSRREAALLGAQDARKTAARAPSAIDIAQFTAEEARAGRKEAREVEAHKSKMNEADRSALDNITQRVAPVINEDNPELGGLEFQQFASNFAKDTQGNAIPLNQVTALGSQGLVGEYFLREALAKESGGFFAGLFGTKATPAGMTPSGVSVLDFVNEKAPDGTEFFWDADNLEVTVRRPDNKVTTIELDVDDDASSIVQNYIASTRGALQPLQRGLR